MPPDPIVGELVGGGDSLQARGFDVRGEVDPDSAARAAACGEVAPFGPVVDDVGFDAEVGGDLGDGVFGVAAGPGVDIGVLVRGAGGPLAAGGLDLGWEGDAPASRRTGSWPVASNGLESVTGNGTAANERD
jgi:hypothetical protein